MEENKSPLERIGGSFHRGGLWVLGMLYVFLLMGIILTVLSVFGVIDPSERVAGDIRELTLVPGEPETCHPSYDKCLDPEAKDYDCKGGSVQDGPLFIEGPVIVDGPDVFELDGDGNGIACEEG